MKQPGSWGANWGDLLLPRGDLQPGPDSDAVARAEGLKKN